ncbi:MAG: FliA/WhiG family RNA polymerase sigma factor [Microthrixaceae bacterium]
MSTAGEAEVRDLTEASEVEVMWARYQAAPTAELRDTLILHYSPLVKYVASRVSVGLPQNVEHGDLVSYGMFGLIDAIDKFEPERGFKFETYAISRIKGAILDELRSIDWVPRSVRVRVRSVEKAYAKLEGLLGRVPTDNEVAAELGWSEDQFQQALSQIAVVGMAALDEILLVGGERGEALTLGDTIADSGHGPTGAFEVTELRHLLSQAINGMPEREKVVLMLYYYESLTLAEVGRVLGVTESRACQIHSKAMIQLRSRLRSLDHD